MTGIDVLAQQVEALDRSVTRLHASFERRTRLRSVVTLAAAAVVAVVALTGSLVVIDARVGAHEVEERRSWCTVWRLLGDDEAARAEAVRNHCE